MGRDADQLRGQNAYLMELVDSLKLEMEQLKQDAITKTRSMQTLK